MKRSFRLACITLLCGMGSAAAAKADDQDTPFYDLDIEALPLTAAVKYLSDETGIEVLYFSEIAEGVTSSPVKGEFTPQEALETMLVRTDLEIVQLDQVGAVAIRPADDDGGDSDSKNLSPAPILMAQNTTHRKSTTTSRNEGGGTSVVTGRVTDARTGANLKGAKITIEETGQWTSTDNLGEFRFVNVPNGPATLTVSFLGYAGQSAEIRVHRGSASHDFALRGGSEIEEVVVFGQRSARVQALNIERTAQNAKSVITADQLGEFNGATISEALRRAPGIAFVQDPATGEGAQVIVRGLEPDFNQVTLNGVRLTDGTGFGRSPDLSSILTESIESVTINTSLLPSQDSNGAGALIEIETKSPLDRPSRFGSFTAEYGDVDGDFGDEFEVGGTLSGIFGREQDFGASVSVSYRERERTSISYETGPRFGFGQYLPAAADGTPIRDTDLIDPRTVFPVAEGANEIYPLDGVFNSSGMVKSEALSVTGSLEKQFGSHTNLRLDVTRNEREIENYTSTFQIGANAGYDLAPVPELGGEVRWSFVTENPQLVSDPDGQAALGNGILGALTRRAGYSPSAESANTTLSLRGDTSLEDWDFDYGVGYSQSTSDAGPQFSLNLSSAGIAENPGFGSSTVLVDRDFLTERALQNVTGDGRIVSVFSPLTPGSEAFISPLFTDDAFTFFNNIDLVPVSQIDFREPGDNGTGETRSANFTVSRSFSNSKLAYLSAGVDYREDTFEAPGDDVFAGEEIASYRFADGTFPSDVGLQFGPGNLTRVGAQGDFDNITRGSAEGLFNSLDSLIASGALTPVRQNPVDLNSVLDTSETILTAFVEGEVNFWGFQLIGGFRFESIEVESTSFLGARYFRFPSTPESLELSDQIQAAGEFITESVDQTEVMPRFILNYRPNENLIMRASYFETVSRPQINDLTQRRSVTLADLPSFFGGASLNVSGGNPDLKPARTRNYDLRVERYTENAGVLKASVFYKEIENPLRANVTIGSTDILPADLTLPDFDVFNENLPDPLRVIVTFPENGDEEDKIWGFDLVAEQQLAFLPPLFDGLGVYANYTYTDSDGVRRFNVDTSIDPEGVIEVDGIPFDGSPEHQGTVGLTYTNYDVDAALFYTSQARRLRSFEAFGLSEYEEAFDTLDLQVAYTREISGSDVRFFLAANDLLRDEDDAFLRQSFGGEDGVPKYFTSATYLGGRTVVVGVSGTFGR